MLVHAAVDNSQIAVEQYTQILKVTEVQLLAVSASERQLESALSV